MTRSVTCDTEGIDVTEMEIEGLAPPNDSDTENSAELPGDPDKKA